MTSAHAVAGARMAPATVREGERLTRKEAVREQSLNRFPCSDVSWIASPSW